MSEITQRIWFYDINNRHYDGNVMDHTKCWRELEVVGESRTHWHVSTHWVYGKDAKRIPKKDAPDCYVFSEEELELRKWDQRNRSRIVELVRECPAHVLKQVDCMVSDGLPLNAEVEWILGRPNFWCSSLAEALRAKGFEIERRSEAEQAFCIYWMLGLYLKDRAGWREAFDREMQS